MIGKFLLFAFVCVSFVQGGPLEDAIEKGLNRAKYVDESGQRRIKSAELNVMSKTKLIQSTVADIKLRARKTQEEAKKSLRSVAQTMEEKAKELSKPDSVFNCIRRNEDDGNSQIEILTNRLEIALEKLEKTKLENFNNITMSYKKMADALTAKYQSTVQSIKNCKTSSCVETAVNNFSIWLNKLFDDIRRIEGQIYTIVSTFKREASNNSANTSSQVSRLRSTTMRNIRQCLYDKESIFEQ